MTASLEALCETLLEGVNLRWYIGPADVLCRTMAGDVVTYDDMLTDQSPFVRTLINAKIVGRLRFMVDSTTPEEPGRLRG